MAITALTLIQELGARLGEFATFSATADGTATTIISTELTKYFPQDNGNLNTWIYASVPTHGPIPPNAGQEVRAASWAVVPYRITLHTPGFTDATESADQYELHRRTPRSRKLAALNSSIRQLGLGWPREVIDESLTTVANQWTYVLPSNQNWLRVWKVEIQVNTAQASYPYSDARSWGAVARKSVDTSGVESWVLQFTTLPPPGRKLRVFGDAWFGEPAADSDIVPLGGVWQGIALEWIYDWAKFRIQDEQADKYPAGDSDKQRVRAQDKLMETRDFLLRNRRTLGSARVNVPGDGTGTLDISPQDRWKWLGVFGNTH